MTGFSRIPVLMFLILGSCSPPTPSEESDNGSAEGVVWSLFGVCGAMDGATKRAMGNTGILPQVAFPPSMVVMALSVPE